MAQSILDQYGIKEVADITFYALDDSGKPTNPVLYIDTAKVSTIEQTAENTEARGGKGNAALISWDFGKEITLSITDALYSPKSMAVMFGDGSVKNYGNNALIMKTEKFRADANVTAGPATNAGWNSQYLAPDGKLYAKVNPKFYTAGGNAILDANNINNANEVTLTSGEIYFCTYDLNITGFVIEISANTFPGTYYITGDTFARSYASGRDEFFQFIVPKGKIQPENTITLEAEGDPSTFDMNVKVLRPENGVMVQLVQYDLAGVGSNPTAADLKIYHNHTLNPATAEG